MWLDGLAALRRGVGARLSWRCVGRPEPQVLARLSGTAHAAKIQKSAAQPTANSAEGNLSCHCAVRREPQALGCHQTWEVFRAQMILDTRPPPRAQPYRRSTAI